MRCLIRTMLLLLVACAVEAGLLLFAAPPPVPKNLDGAAAPGFDLSDANQLPMTGYFEKTIAVGDAKRTVEFYISKNEMIRSYFTVIAVPGGVAT
jgi:hypothetical protein